MSQFIETIKKGMSRCWSEQCADEILSDHRKILRVNLIEHSRRMYG